MASKGPKTGASTKRTPARKPARRSSKPATPEANAAVQVEKKPAPATPAKPVPVAAAAPQPAPAVEKKIEAADKAAVTATQVARAAADTVKKEATIMPTTVESNVNKAEALFADINARAKAALEKNVKIAEEFNDFAKGNVEAVVESGRITAKGLEALGQDAAEYGRKSFESATAALKNLATVKSPTEFFKLQSDYVRQSFDSYVAEASKNAEAVLKLAGDAAQPISNRFAVAADKVKAVA